MTACRRRGLARQAILNSALVTVKIDVRAEVHAHRRLGPAPVNDKRTLSTHSYDERMEWSIVNKAALICRHWGPKLRYRAIDATARDVSTVGESAVWFQRNSSSL